MPIDALKRVIVIPRNGYINRLQAWASADILAAGLAVPSQILWEPEPVAPAPAELLFDQAHATFLQRSEVDALLGCAHESLPRYLTSLPGQGVLFLAGHDAGEQVFMDQVQKRLQEESPHTLVIVAGGRFHLASASDFTLARKRFYEALVWSSELEQAYQDARPGDLTYLGLHVRTTDRSVQAPSRSAMREAIKDLAAETGLSSVFVAADTPAARDAWMRAVERLELDAWCAPILQASRTQTAGGISALVDWRLLAGSRGMVFTGVSSFAQEAAVASGHLGSSRSLAASGLHRGARRARALVGSALTYPQRHLWTRPSS